MKGWEMGKFGDTPKNFGTNLCEKCKYGTIVKGEQYKNKIIYCSRLETKVQFIVNECSKFEQHNTPDLFDLQRIAWKVVADKKTGTIGFVNPDKAYKLIKSGTHEELGHGILDE